MDVSKIIEFFTNASVAFANGVCWCGHQVYSLASSAVPKLIEGATAVWAVAKPALEKLACALLTKKVGIPVLLGLSSWLSFSTAMRVDDSGAKAKLLFAGVGTLFSAIIIAAY
jgi:hypothetical protein